MRAHKTASHQRTGCWARAAQRPLVRSFAVPMAGTECSRHPPQRTTDGESQGVEAGLSRRSQAVLMRAALHRHASTDWPHQRTISGTEADAVFIDLGIAGKGPKQIERGVTVRAGVQNQFDVA